MIQFYLFYYIPIFADWISLVMLLYTLNEIAALQLKYQKQDEEIEDF
jgi:hypothetical protein